MLSLSPPVTPSWRERILVYGCLLLLSNGLLSQMLASPSDPDGSPLLRLLWPPVYLMGAVLAGRSGVRFLKASLGAIFLLAMVGLAAVSLIWSITPEVTLRRVIAISGTMLFAVGFAARYSWFWMLRIIASVFLTLAVGSYVMAFAFPALGVMGDPHPGAWAGLWWEKNALGSIMTTSVIACISAAAIDRRLRAVWCAGAALSIGLVILSTSRTSLLALTACLGVACLIWLIRRGPISAIVTLWSGTAVTGGLIAFVALAPEVALGLIGRDLSLTGRADLWVVLAPMIHERFATGFGYGAFWHDPDGPVVIVRRILDWSVPMAHNGWLEVLLGLGFGGVVLFALQCAVSFVLALRQLADGSIGPAWWCIIMPLGFLMVSLSESAIFQYHELSWTLFVVTTAKLALPDVSLSSVRRSSATLGSQARQNTVRPVSLANARSI